jgi:hypothetical protein
MQPFTIPKLGWKGKYTEVKRLRFAETYLALEAQSEDYERKAKRFEHQLRFGERWERLRREFGPGVFALLPRTVVTNTWVEQTLNDAPRRLAEHPQAP